MKSLINHSIDDYEGLLNRLLAEFPVDVAMGKAVGSVDLGDFRNTGDIHVEVLRYHGLVDGMSIYDLGCGSGRTAQALERAGWSGRYFGADIVARLVNHLNATCHTLRAVVNTQLTLVARDASLDMVFHWSVFTHLFPEECFAYLKEIRRALKPGGKVVFSFMELEDENHYARIFKPRVTRFEKGADTPHLDTFLHRDWIRAWARELGFSAPQFTDGADTTHHRKFWQTLVAMRRES